MVGLNKTVISEILKNQEDLEIVVGQDIDSMRFFFTISTGSRKGLRVLFTSESSFRRESEVLEGVQEFFDAVCDFGEHGSPTVGFIKHIIGPREKVTSDETTYFSRSIIELILEDLDKYRVAKTQIWFPDKET